MSRYKPYPKYKKSGVEWLGEVPEHWNIGLLSTLFNDNKEKNIGMKNKNLLSLSYGKIIKKDINTTEGLLPASFESYQIVHPGYIVLRLTDLQNDKKSLRTGLVKEDGIITSAYVGLSKKSKSIGDERYFHAFLHTFDTYKGFYGMGAGVRQSLNFEELKKLKFLLPPISEQTTIADFLDRETAKIDTLIGKQERLIELLQEKRQALISHAVTKGLDPNVKMKDSGVAWLGKVPEHWTVSALKYNLTNLDYKRIPVNATERESMSGTYPYYGASGIIDYINDYIFDIKTILIGEDGANLIMRSTPLAFIAEGQYWVNNHAHILLPNDGNHEFWVYVLNNIDIAPFVSGSAQPKLTAETLGNLLLAYPPTSTERKQIADYLDTQTSKIDTLIKNANQAIKLLKERRTALISAAVTGKIDVREIAV